MEDIKAEWRKFGLLDGERLKCDKCDRMSSGRNGIMLERVYIEIRLKRGFQVLCEKCFLQEERKKMGNDEKEEAKEK